MKADDSAADVAPHQHGMDVNVRRKMQLRYGLACGVTALGSAYLFYRIPHDHPLMVVPQVLLIAAILIPVLMWQSMADAKTGPKIAGIASCVLWVLGIGASFKIAPGTSLICVPDSLLLLGFVPLLYLWRFSWTWIVFGLLNFLIGIFLQMITYMSDQLFPSTALFAKHHLASYHPAITWWLLGIMSTMCGVVKFVLNRCTKRKARPST